MTKQITFRSATNLSNLECKMIIEKANKLFSLMEFTEKAEQFLEFNSELAEVIKKW